MSDYTTKRCTVCQREFPSTPEHFSRKRGTVSGLYSQCKECANAKKRKGTKRVATKDGFRKCYACQEWKPLTHEYFHRNNSDEKGFSHVCIDCSLARHDEYRRKKGIPARPRKPKIEGMEYCRKCDTYYPATTDYFNRDKKQASGLKGTCRICANKQSKNWRERNPDKQKQSQHAWYDDKGVEYHRGYTDKNREKTRLIVIKRRARKLSLPDTLTKEEWFHALDYFKGCCAICGRPAGFWHTIAADHWIPLSHPDCTGTIVTNIIPMCHGNDGCNNSKNDNDALQWLHKTYGDKKGNTIYQRIINYFEWAKSPHGE